MAPTRIWIDPRGWPEQLYERLLDRRIVMAHGHLDGDAATRLAAQLLTLDADGTAPIRLELQNLGADLPAALSVMGILDVVRGPVTGYAGGRIDGPALGILAACRHRRAYPNALSVLSEPQVSFDGTVTALASREEQARVMLDELFGRVAEVTGRDTGQVRADARRDKLFNVAEAASVPTTRHWAAGPARLAATSTRPTGRSTRERPVSSGTGRTIMPAPRQPATARMITPASHGPRVPALPRPAGAAITAPPGWACRAVPPALLQARCRGPSSAPARPGG